MIVIQTTRMEISTSLYEPPTPFQYEQMVAWLNDPDLMQYSEQRHKKHTIESQKKYVDSIKWPHAFYLIHFGGAPQASHSLIGTMTAFVDLHNNVADLGILIGRDFRGQGFGLEAWSALSDYLLGTGTRKIEAGCMETNQRMISIFVKSGMKYESIRPDHFLLNGQPCNAVYYGRVK